MGIFEMDVLQRMFCDWIIWGEILRWIYPRGDLMIGLLEGRFQDGSISEKVLWLDKLRGGFKMNVFQRRFGDWITRGDVLIVMYSRGGLVIVLVQVCVISWLLSVLLTSPVVAIATYDVRHFNNFIVFLLILSWLLLLRFFRYKLLLFCIVFH